MAFSLGSSAAITGAVKLAATNKVTRVRFIDTSPRNLRRYVSAAARD
jgi:hypothetical protein